MILVFLLSFIPVVLGFLIAVPTSGGNFAGVIDIPDFLCVFVIFVLCVFISGYGKPFCRIFSSKEKFNGLNLEELKQTDFSLELAGKILLYSALLFPSIGVIYLCYNISDSNYPRQSLGPNTAILLISLLYTCVFEMIILTLKAKVKKDVILYMAESDEINAKVEKTKISLIVKMITGFILLVAVSGFYITLMGGYSWGVNILNFIIDWPSLLSMILFVLPAVIISGNIKNLFGAFKTLFERRKISITEKNLYLNVIHSVINLNWYAGVTTTLIGWLGILRNLEDARAFLPNVAVSLIPVFHAVLFNFVLLIVKTRIHKVSQ